MSWIEQEFAGRTAIVTGGSLGIGYAAAQRLVEGGANVVICGSRAEVGENAVRQLREAGKGHIRFKRTNVRNAAEVEALIAFAVSEFGGVDLLVNSAGIQRYGDVVETPEEVWDDVIDINLKGMYLTSKYVIPHMRQRGGGAIVNVSSVQAFASQKGVAAYTASKGGINALTRAMALDHAGENIRVNAVCPASVDTPMLRWAADLFKGEATQEKLVGDWGRMHPLGRIGKQEEVAELIVFLLSNRAAFITGGEYKIDGGMLAALGVALPE